MFKMKRTIKLSASSLIPSVVINPFDISVRIDESLHGCTSSTPQSPLPGQQQASTFNLIEANISSVPLRGDVISQWKAEVVCTVHRNLSVISRELIAGRRFGSGRDSEEQPRLINCLNLGISQCSQTHRIFKLSRCQTESVGRWGRHQRCLTAEIFILMTSVGAFPFIPKHQRVMIPQWVYCTMKHNYSAVKSSSNIYPTKVYAQRALTTTSSA